MNKPGKHEYRSCFVDMVQVGEFVQHGECDQRVDISDTEGGGLAEDVQNSEASVQEIPEDEHEEEVKQPISQSQSSVHSSRGHTPFDFVWKRDTNISRCDDGTEVNETNYSEFVSDLQDMVETAYSDVRQSLLRSSASAERCI